MERSCGHEFMHLPSSSPATALIIPSHNTVLHSLTAVHRLSFTFITLVLYIVFSRLSLLCTCTSGPPETRLVQPRRMAMVSASTDQHTAWRRYQSSVPCSLSSLFAIAFTGVSRSSVASGMMTGPSCWQWYVPMDSPVTTTRH
jgi:hypothetical protein